MVDTMRIVIGHLYPELMNIYGDRGNIITLTRRCEWRRISVELVPLSLGDRIEVGRFDLFFMGGGQDREQLIVAGDLRKVKGEALRTEFEEGAAALVICGGYQLFGKFYRPFDGEALTGIEVFDAWTVAGDKRFIGNVVVESSVPDAPGTIVGFENHSGKTFLGPGCSPLGKVNIGRGNNSEDGTEGAIYKSVVGTYLHGSLLPKNPRLADFLISRALRRRYGEVDLPPLNDALELEAHRKAVKRAAARP